MARTHKSILEGSKGRIIAISVNNSKIDDTTFVGKVVRTSPQYVTLQTFANAGFKGGFETIRRTRKFHRNSITHVTG